MIHVWHRRQCMVHVLHGNYEWFTCCMDGSEWFTCYMEIMNGSRVHGNYEWFVEILNGSRVLWTCERFTKCVEPTTYYRIFKPNLLS